MNNTEINQDAKPSFNEWALVELFGHQKIVGKVSEATLAGGAFLRVDVPAFDGLPAFTRFYGSSAIYSINPVTEEIARGLCERYRNEPVSRFELPQIEEKCGSDPNNPNLNQVQGPDDDDDEQQF